MELITSSKFDSDLRHFLSKNPNYKSKIKKCFLLMLSNLYHPSLRLHKLSGQENYSISVDMKIRIIINMNEDKIFLLRIGNHNQVY